ncbi:DUF6950 family protein [Variovorax ginsengisoli]|uniref:DUF6950 domain-containing protein n=1 Tax=Variovorax ginsengisoli TaxID=363844 RepID=A0ABT8SFD1_9BURK|nr:hypothetical protein [Variovorax ginsengisoli]MDN8617879.1 hypothetical protein [Variovorax ginsengisoli]MDO1537049.1 hypothetical protein [Variovorax ginsengisoli]
MRRSDWQQRFSAFAAERRGMAFAWGQNDCCLFAADAVLAMTGDDWGADYRGTYDDVKSALRVMPEGGLREVATRALGEPVTPLMAAVGDVLLMMNEDRELLAICNGVNAIGPGPSGIVVLGMESALAAWKV